MLSDNCCKCDSINVNSFTFTSFEFFTQNTVTPLFEVGSSPDSIVSSCFSPHYTRSPHLLHTRSHRHHKQSSDASFSKVTRKSSTAPEDALPRSTNLRLPAVNYCYVRTNRAEFSAAVDYIKPDLICRTEMWLRGIKPGRDPDTNAIKSSEVFPPNYTIHRTDRSVESGGGVFTATEEGLISDAQP